MLLHGRSGPYSSLANGVYTDATLSKRHAMWARFWQERGYVALVVDSFGPRGYPQGFPRGSYAQRPPEVSEHPGAARQSRDANRRATHDATARAERFFRRELGR